MTEKCTQTSDQVARKHVEGVVIGYSDHGEAIVVPHQDPVTVGAGTAANDNVAVLEGLPHGKIVYLASPYSLYKHGFHMAARHASRAAAALMSRGLVVYAPISHGHAVAQDNDLPTTWEFWKGQCQPFIDAASACVVLKLEGWKESVGVSYEVDCFEAAGKPVVYVTPEELGMFCGATVEEEVRMSVNEDCVYDSATGKPKLSTFDELVGRAA